MALGGFRRIVTRILRLLAHLLQLAQTQAEMDYVNARYAYQTALAVVRFQTGQ